VKALVLAEHSDRAAGLAAGARTLADETLVVAFGAQELPANIADTVIRIDMPADAVLDDAADTVISIVNDKSPDVVLVEPVRRMKSIAGKLAAHHKTSVITDVFALNEGVATSMYFGGVGIREQKAGGLAIYTLNPEVFGELTPSGENKTEHAAWVQPAQPIRLISSKPKEKSEVNLAKADCIVAAGRGFAQEEELGLAWALCNKLDAGLACSRPLTEGVNWLPTERYVGVSGLMLSPKTYVAVGISGQMQHMVGCNRATTLFAINKDPNAPIFKQCDYGLVGDLKVILPALIEAL